MDAEQVKQLSDRELEVEIAKSVMGLGDIRYRNNRLVYGRRPGQPPPVPSYASDGRSMLQLLERMRQRGWCCDLLSIPSNGHWHCKMTVKGKGVAANSATAPRAVAEAVYQAVHREGVG